MATLVLENLRKSFGNVHVLHGIDMALASGEMVVIVGESGCGKSTLLRLVAGLETPTEGRIVLDGEDVARRDPAARDIAMVFQNYALYPHMTVFENMAYGLRIRGMAKSEITRRVDEAAEMLGLKPMLARRPRQLSGGQRQRVAMGRAIVREPKLFLFDEPLSNLDAKLRLTMRGEIRQLQRRMGVTSLYVTHDQVEAMTLGDRLLVMNKGRPVQLASPMEVFERPADRFVAGFIGAPAMNFLPATLSHDGSLATLTDGTTIPLPGRRRDGPITLGIRPEHLELAPQGLALRVQLVELLGSETVVIGRLANGDPISIRVPGPPPAALDDTLHVTIPGTAAHLFDAESGVRVE